VALGTVAALASGAFLLGYAVRHYEWPPHEQIVVAYDLLLHAVRPPSMEEELARSIRWHAYARADVESGLREAELDALGYLDGYEAPPEQTGVTLARPGQMAPGPTLILSGHTTGGVLVDAAGRVLHRWSLPYERACPDEPDVPDDRRSFWRHALPVGQGGLLVIFDYRALVRIDRHSQVVWSRCEPFHHQVARGPGDRLIGIRRRARDVVLDGRGRPLLDDEIVELAADGSELRAVSVFDAIARSAYAPVLERIGEVQPGELGDHLHTNAVEALGTPPGDAPPVFAPGRWLVSLRNLDLVGVIDPAEGRLVWGLSALWRHQHDPALLADGHLLVFDNEGNAGRSRVVEVDPTTGEIAWAYTGAPGAPFTSGCCGLAQRLQNGNTLITVTTSGHAFEVTRSGEVVWDYWNPERAGPDDAYIAALFHVERLGEAEAREWLGTEAIAARFR
jgi:hypothetical protein